MEEERIYAERPNKTAIKREMLELRDLGKQLIAAPDSWLDELPLGDRLRKEIMSAKRFTKGALRRQLIFIEKLMRDDDVDQIKQHLEDLQRPHKVDTEKFHQIEEWRDNLLGGDNNLLEELLDQYGTLDRQHIRQLVRNANKEKKLNKSPKSSRSLFRYLKESVG